MSVWEVVMHQWNNTLCDEIGPDLTGRDYPIHGGNEKMDTIQIEAGSSPLETGWKPGQIYEVCMVDGEYKVQYIQQLRGTYARHHYISDRDHAFRTLKDIKSLLDALAAPADLLILDISELLYLDFVKDVEMLRENIKALYSSLERLCKLGINSVVFVNYYYYYYIFHHVVRPPTIQVVIIPSLTLPLWEQELTSQASLPDWRSFLRK